jgi:F0F1-type ATP synthase gamma subunit
MRRPLEIKAEEGSMRTIVSLTSAFESLSSMKITQTKNKVLISNEFFTEVWSIYKQIRVDVMFNFGRTVDEKPIDKELLILITAQGGLSGDIDQRLIRRFREHYDPEKNDIVVTTVPRSSTSLKSTITSTSICQRKTTSTSIPL